MPRTQFPFFRSTEIVPVAISQTEVAYLDGVTSAIQGQLDAKVAKATYTAHTILYATTTATPVALTVGASTVVGRASTGNIVALSKSDLLTLLNVADGANAYLHPTTNGNLHVPESGATAQILQWSSAGTAKWVTVSGQASIADGGAVSISLLSATAGAITASKAVIVGTAGGVTGLGPITFTPAGTSYIPLLIGTKSNAAGSGVKLVATGADDSAGVQIYAEDGGSAAAAGEVISPFRSRYLLTSTAEAGGYTETALFAQLVSTGAKAWSAGVFEAAYIFNQAGTITLTGTAQTVGLNVATTMVGAMTVGASAEMAGIDVNIRGTGAFAGTAANAAAIFIRSSETPIWPNGLKIKSGGALVGIDMATTTRGIVSTVSTLAPGSTPGNSFIVTAAAPANDYGAAGYFEADVAGAFAGHFYGMGSWINFGTASVTGAGNIIAAQDNGIYGTATMTNSIVIFGLRAEAILTGTPAAFCPFSLNTNNQAITALFHIASSAAINCVNRTISINTVATGTVPLFCDPDGSNVRYVHYYSAVD